MLLPGQLQQPGQPGQRRQFSHADPAPAGQAGIHRHAAPHGFGFLQQIPRPGNQPAPGLAQFRLVAGTVEQAHAQRLFEFVDALGQRGNGQVQPLGRDGEAGAGGRPVEGLELLERHGSEGGSSFEKAKWLIGILSLSSYNWRP